MKSDYLADLNYYWKKTLELTHEILHHVKQNDFTMAQLEALIDNRARLMNLIEDHTLQVKRLQKNIPTQIGKMQNEFSGLNVELIENLIHLQVLTKEEIKNAFNTRNKIQSYHREL